MNSDGRKLLFDVWCINYGQFPIIPESRVKGPHIGFSANKTCQPRLYTIIWLQMNSYGRKLLFDVWCINYVQFPIFPESRVKGPYIGFSANKPSQSGLYTIIWQQMNSGGRKLSFDAWYINYGQFPIISESRVKGPHIGVSANKTCHPGLYTILRLQMNSDGRKLLFDVLMHQLRTISNISRKSGQRAVRRVFSK